MSRRGWLILVGSLFLPGLLCLEAFVLLHKEPYHERIPDGAYRPASGDDLITIDGDRIRYVVHDKDPAPTSVFVREYDYSVNQDGTLFVQMTSAEFGNGPVGRYDWSWDGNVITRRENPLRKAPSGHEPPLIFKRAAEPPRD
ncbi:MAG TPA: hypothetical protein VGS03_00470 [Candidatus Polarisedimenticolia bacterium]|jgi:hypothetical protein|nr:hypothetical protein [Candidatus Polarisedimenticolia bacterium]